jgi:hypothetical protein
MTWRGRSNPIEYRGERVVTLRQVDEVHGLAEGRTRKNFAEHRDELQEGVHYHVADRASEIRTVGGRLAGSDPGIYLTERGYLLRLRARGDELLLLLFWELHDLGGGAHRDLALADGIDEPRRAAGLHLRG